MERNSICIIGVYFGKLPNYFELWLKSAAKNSKIDFLLFTDVELSVDYDNITVVSMTLSQMKQLAEEKLGMQISLERPYKCCDFKVVYGKIFQDFITQYEYWGHCDFDLIWGDIYSFLVHNKYQTYDRFMNLGHCSLYRNTETVNNYYLEEGSACGEYTEVFTQDRNFAFDEWNGLEKIYDKNGYSIFRGRIFADISTIHHRYRLALQDINYDYQVFYWDNGHVYRAYLHENKLKREEFIYIHFQKRPNFEIDNDVLVSDRFYITNRGFINKTESIITKEIMQRMNPYKGRLFERVEMLKRELKKYKGRIEHKFKMGR